MGKRETGAGIVFTIAAGVLAFAAMAHAQADVTPPVVPSSITASLTPSNQVSVVWSPTTDDVGVAGYYLYRNGSLVANTPGDTYYTDTATPGVYYYTVAAYDAAGNVSAQSSPSALVTVLPDNTAPTTPTGLTFAAASTSATLLWQPSSDNFGVVGYYIYRNGQRIVTDSPIISNTYTDSGLIPGTSYSYAVAAYDAAGNISARTAPMVVTAIFDVTPPSVPSAFRTTAILSTEVDLSWNAATDNVGVAGYNIYRDGVAVGTAPSSSLAYADYGLLPQTTYAYQVAAVDVVGNVSAMTLPVRVTTQAPDTQPPSSPRNIAAIALSSSQVMLSWRPSTDNVGVTGYYIYRDEAQIDSIGPSSTLYIDSGLATNTVYSYYVKAYDAAGNISPLTSVSVTTLADTAAVVPPPDVSTSASGTSSGPEATPGTGNGAGAPAVRFTLTLLPGARNGEVVALQDLLIAQGYLGAGYNTGYFGGLTQKAVQRFQCAENIICAGSPQSTGWGMVGSRTRKALNGL